MKRLVMLFVIGLILAAASSPAAFAQDEHGSIGAFFDYVRLGQANDLNQYGIGGRFGVNAGSLFVFEGEGAYDFRQSRSLQDITTIPPTTFRADVRTVTGLFGPKI